MPTERVILMGLTLLTGAAGLAACSGGDDKPAPAGIGARGGSGGDSGGTGGSAASGGLGGSAGQAGVSGSGGSGDPDGSAGAAGGGVGGTAGSGGSGNDGSVGTGGEPEPDAGTCGNGTIEPGEGCELSEFLGKTCASYGYDQGSLVCVKCAIDIRGCSGVERCGNGRDDDADGDVDCDDSECVPACADACSSPELIPDPSTTGSTTVGHAAVLAPSCLSPGSSSSGEVVYQVDVETTGVLDVKLTSSADLNLSVRTTCTSAGSELACSDRASGTAAVEGVVVPVNRGDRLFIVVDGSQEIGTFTLDVGSRPVVCGDSHRDLAEECDDGDLDSNDGCSSSCKLEPSEVEPNGTVAQATPFETPGVAIGSITPAGDVDMYSLQVLLPNSMIGVQVTDLGDGACAAKLLDSYVQILAPDGVTVLAENDDYGGNYCSRTTAWQLAPGIYYARVTALASTATFPYGLVVRR